MFCRHVFGNISGGFRGISRFLGNFAGPRPREISEALYKYLNIHVDLLNLIVQQTEYFVTQANQSKFLFFFNREHRLDTDTHKST